MLTTDKEEGTLGEILTSEAAAIHERCFGQKYCYHRSESFTKGKKVFKDGRQGEL
jgi:hypothetical protein